MSERDAIARLAALVSALCAAVERVSFLNPSVNIVVRDDIHSIRTEAEAIIRGEFGP